jgi:hypothetical protein
MQASPSTGYSVGLAYSLFSAKRRLSSWLTAVTVHTIDFGSFNLESAGSEGNW